MTNSRELKKIIHESGLKYKVIAKNMGISYFGLQKKIDNVTEFKASEISILCTILNIKNPKIKEEIFFNDDVD